MIIFVLIYTGLLLLITNIGRRFGGHLVAALIAGASLMPAYYLGSPFLILYGLALAVAGFACLSSGATPKRFLKASVAITVVMDVLVGIPMIYQGTYRVIAEAPLAKEFPSQSIEERLTYERHPPMVSQFDEQELATLEDGILGRSSGRYHHLRDVHEHYLIKFISAPGFGVARTLRTSEYPLQLEVPEPISLPPSIPEDWSTLDTQDGTNPIRRLEGLDPKEFKYSDALSDLWFFHRSSLFDFTNPAGFGYVKDKQHVAGFQAHQFHELPMLGAPRWELRHLELVSLLKFEEPAVYVTDYLPRMDDLRDAPTRPLNGFERTHLHALQEGEDLAVDSNADRIYMLGSIRAGKQCLQCHTAERGALLGAFSYQFCRVAP